MTKVWQVARGKMIGRGGWMGNMPKEIRKEAGAEKSMRWKEQAGEEEETVVPANH